MEDKKYQIFISSTFLDLEDVRSKVSKTILNLYHFPIGMEMFSAGDSEQWQIITETIDVSDYYILIIGHRYGSLSSDGISFTEKEFDYAVQKGIPVLSFIRQRDIPTTSSEREQDPDTNRKLDRFIEKAKNNKMCEFWTAADDLATKIAVALPKTFKRVPRVGWIRDTGDNSKQILAELSLLSTENRRLRQIIEDIKNSAKEAIPEIEVEVNDTRKIIIKAFDSYSINKIEKPKQLQFEQIHSQFKEHLKPEDIRLYNESLPTREEVDAYNLEWIYYRTAKEAHVPLKIKTTNNSTNNANDLHVTLKFPAFIQVREEFYTQSLEQPVHIIPDHPDQIAMLRYFKSARGDTTEVESSFEKPKSLTEKALAGTTRNPLASHNVYSDDQSIHIHLKKLPCNSSTYFGSNEFDLIPLTAGEGFIDVTVICDEFTHSQFFQIPIAVRK